MMAQRNWFLLLKSIFITPTPFNFLMALNFLFCSVFTDHTNMFSKVCLSHVVWSELEVVAFSCLQHLLIISCFPNLVFQCLQVLSDPAKVLSDL